MARTRIYWFSSTGNTLTAVRRLAAALGDTELVPMPRVADQPPRLDDVERVGLAFPVYAWGPPRLVDAFLDRWQGPTNAYLFGLATYGGMPGGALAYVERRLASRGLSLAAGFALRLPSNYTPLAGAPGPRAQARLFRRAEARMDAIAAAVRAKQSVRIRPLMAPVAWLAARLHRGFAAQAAASDRQFSVDPTCTGCGTCERVCPVHNIALRDRRPQWLGHCEQCMGCLQWCPVEAIQFTRATRGRARYRHPDVAAGDFAWFA